MKKSDIIANAVEQLITKGDTSIIESTFAANYTAHAENKVHSGHEFIERFVKLLRTAIPDIKVKNIEILAESKDTVTWQRTLEGTHQAPMMGIPRSNKKLVWNEMIVSRFEGSMIAEEWLVSELMGKMLLG